MRLSIVFAKLRRLMENNKLLDSMDVLVIEDEILIALDIERIVLSVGAKQCRIMRAIDAMNVPELEQFPRDLIVIDHRSFHANWSHFSDLVAQFHSVIVLTTESDTARKLVSNPSTVIVSKPFADNDIIEAVQQLLS